MLEGQLPLDAPELDGPEADAPIDGPDDPWGQIAGLVARYPMDVDPRSMDMIVCSDPSYSATCAGDACPIAAQGTHGGAHVFDGSQHATLPTGSLLGTAPYTVTVWAFTESSTDPYRMMLAKPLDQLTNANVYAIGISGGRIGFETTDGVEFRTLLAPLAFEPVGAWHHYATTWDGTRKHLYLDGIAASNISATLVDSTRPIVIGADIDGGAIANGWIGRLDELRIYSRALDADEIAVLAQL